jgi:hypothetical protein
MGVGAQSGFEVAFQEFVFYAGPAIQMTYWLVMIAAALWAVTLFKRWVDFQTGAGRDVEKAVTPDACAPAATPAQEKPVSVDEFVE